MTRATRIVSKFSLRGGLGLLTWVVIAWQWQDPFTALYTRYEQGALSQRLGREFAAFEPARPPLASVAATRSLSPRQVLAEQLFRNATLFRGSVRVGEPIGRIKVPRMGLNMVLVNGTVEATLTKGPGRDPRSYMPGQGQLIYIAGHRTTYSAPSSEIDQLRKSDQITIEMPYATFVYSVSGFRIVPASDLAVLNTHGHEVVELQACHPRFFATHRYIVTPCRSRASPGVYRIAPRHSGLPPDRRSRHLGPSAPRRLREPRIALFRPRTASFHYQRRLVARCTLP